MAQGCKPTVLVVDNDDRVTLALSTRFERLGYRCVPALTGAQAISAFRESDIDIVITDLNMPAGDGIALASEIRKTSDIPIVFMTGFRDVYRRVTRSVANVFIMEKPFDMQRLIDLVEASIEQADRP
jgi:DNA-binding NtrC family response regulator